MRLCRAEVDPGQPQYSGHPENMEVATKGASAERPGELFSSPPAACEVLRALWPVRVFEDGPFQPGARSAERQEMGPPSNIQFPRADCRLPGNQSRPTSPGVQLGNAANLTLQTGSAPVRSAWEQSRPLPVPPPCSVHRAPGPQAAVLSPAQGSAP